MCVLVGSDFTPPGTLSDEYAFPFLGVQGTSAPGVQDLVLAFGVADRAAGGLLPQSRELLGLVPLLPPPDRALPPAFEPTPVFVPLPLRLGVPRPALVEQDGAATDRGRGLGTGSAMLGSVERVEEGEDRFGVCDVCVGVAFAELRSLAQVASVDGHASSLVQGVTRRRVR